MPDLRPSSPLSSGPTLFLAPAPIAWQAMHLLNDVLPAAASCASAADDDAMTTSAHRVSVFIVCSSWFRGLALRQFVRMGLAVDKRDLLFCALEGSQIFDDRPNDFRGHRSFIVVD